MKIFKSHHNSLKHALLCFISSTVTMYNFFLTNYATLPIQWVTALIQNEFLSIKCAIVLLTLGAAT